MTTLSLESSWVILSETEVLWGWGEGTFERGAPVPKASTTKQTKSLRLQGKLKTVEKIMTKE